MNHDVTSYRMLLLDAGIYIYQKTNKIYNKHLIFIRLFYKWCYFYYWFNKKTSRLMTRNRRGRDRMVVGFVITCTISVQCLISLKLCSWGGVLDTALFVSDWWFSPGTPLSSTIRLTSTIQLKFCWNWRI